MQPVTMIDLVGADDLEASLRNHLARREMPDLFLYLGAEGAGQWLDLDESDSFGVASDLTDLLRASAPAVASHLPVGVSVVGLGVGGGRKERILLEALPSNGPRRYVAADVSPALVEAALGAVADLPVEAIGATARVEDLARLRPHVRPPVLVCLLGNTFSNFEPDRLLKRVRAALGPSDFFLFDGHLAPADEGNEASWRQDVERAYASAENARFNLGPLTARGVPADACRFVLRLVRVPTRHGPTWRTRKKIHVLRDADVSFPTGPVRLRAGEVIRMGFTYKHTRRQMVGWVRMAGSKILEVFSDAASKNLLVLARP